MTRPSNTSLIMLAAAALATLGSAVATAQSAEPKEAGIWFDDTGKGAVQLFACGAKLCGRIVWLKEPLNAEGKPLHDKLNPDPAMQARPICGLQIIGNLSRQPDGTWDEGWVYDPKVGKSYDAAIEHNGRNIILTGYKGVRLLSKSFTWTKAPPTLPLCDASIVTAR